VRPADRSASVVPRGAALAMALSGAGALVQQVLWVRALAPLLGTTVHAEAAVLAAFLGAVAVGAATFGPRADRAARPARLFARLERATALLALATPLLCWRAAQWAAGLEPLAARYLLAALLVAPAGVVMGGTLPCLVRAVLGPERSARAAAGRLYAWNAAGAVCGALAAAAGTLPWLGVVGTALVASALHLLAAHWGGAAETSAADPAPRETNLPGARRSALRSDAAEPSADPAPDFSVLALALVLSGAGALALELFALRCLALSFGGTAPSYGLAVAVFVAGVALGAAFAARLAPRSARVACGWSQWALVAVLVLSTFVLERLSYLALHTRVALHDWPAGYALGLTVQGLATALLFLPPAVLLGCALPWCVDALRPDRARAGAVVGRLYAANTLGNLLGVGAAAFWTLPRLGLQGTFEAVLLLHAAAGTLLLAGRRRAPALALAALFVLGGYALGRRDFLDPLLLGVGTLRERERAPATFAEFRSQYVVDGGGGAGAERLFAAEDEHAAVLVTGHGEHRVLHVNGKPDASTAIDLPTQIGVAQLPFLVRPPRAERALVVGLGSGISLGSLLTQDVGRVDVVELSSAVVAAAPSFAAYHRGALDDPRVELAVGDARHFLGRSDAAYDVIVCEPTNPWQAGAAGLFGAEFLGLLRRHLAPGGVACFWVQYYDLSDELVATLLRGLVRQFPSVELFRVPTVQDLLLLAAEQPLELDPLRVEALFTRTAVREEWARCGVQTPAALLLWHALDHRGIRALVGDGPVHSDLSPLLDYRAPASWFRADRPTLLDGVDLFAAGDGQRSWLLRYEAWLADQGRPLTQRDWQELERSLLGSTGRPSSPPRQERIRLRALAAPPLRAEGVRSQVLSQVRADAQQAHYEGHFEAAVPAYREALRWAVDDADLWRNLAVCLRELGRAEEALPVLERLLELRPQDTVVRAERAAVLAVLGRAADAAQEYWAVLRATPDDANVIADLARLLHGPLGDRAQARALLAEAWERLGPRPELRAALDALSEGR
jgi:spermidine synthase